MQPDIMTSDAQELEEVPIPISQVGEQLGPTDQAWSSEPCR